VSLIELYRVLYEYEKDCNQKMLAMLAAVPEGSRGDARFQRAVTLADHLAAGREKWLHFMEGKGPSQLAWWDEHCDLSTLRARFAAVEITWTEYLARLEHDQLAGDFEFFQANGASHHLPIEMLIVQLIGHAPYHRGQVALLVDQLGRETVDTDYMEWWMNVKDKP
jgi:uncharacterized damage-inducible protein DinB